MHSLTVVLLLSCCFAVAVECQLPFFLKTTERLPTEDSYYQQFEQVPPKEETAEKLVTNFLGIHPGAAAKRSTLQHDNVAVLDASGSIGLCEFKKGRRAMRDTMKIVTPGHDYHYAGVVYSSSSSRLFNFLPGTQAADEIDVAPYLNSGTNTAAGLLEAKELFLDSNSGVRPFATFKRVFLLTDGQSNIDKDQTIPRAQELKNLGIKVFVVAVGSFQNNLPALVEMAKVASYPPEEHLYRVASYGDFIEVVKLAIDRIGLDYVQVVGNLPPPC